MVPTLVLAAGYGARLDPLTRLLAKAALPVAGRTIIERVLGWLVREGVSDVVINLHHRPETIAAIVGDGAGMGLRVRYSWEPVLLGSAGGPRHALPLLADPLLIVNAEPLVDVAIEPLIEAHTRTGADVTLAVVPNPDPEAFNGLRAGSDGIVREVVPKGRSAGTWHFVGIQAAAARVFAGLPDGVAADTIHGIYRAVIDAGTLRVHPVEATPIHIGTPREYLAATLALSRLAPSDAVIEPGVADVAPSARIRRTVVWPGARVGPEADLCGCIVTGVSLPRGFAARDVAIVPAGVAGRDDRAERRGDLALFGIT